MSISGDNIESQPRHRTNSHSTTPTKETLISSDEEGDSQLRHRGGDVSKPFRKDVPASSDDDEILNEKKYCFYFYFLQPVFQHREVIQKLTSSDRQFGWIL